MKNWLKENWFKIIIIILALFYLLILSYEQYRLAAAHNKQVIKDCIELKDKFSGDKENIFNDCVKNFKIWRI